MTPRTRCRRARAPACCPRCSRQHGVEVLDTLTYRTKDTDYSAHMTPKKSPFAGMTMRNRQSLLTTDTQ